MNKKIDAPALEKGYMWIRGTWGDTEVSKEYPTLAAVEKDLKTYCKDEDLDSGEQFLLVKVIRTVKAVVGEIELKEV